MRKTPSDMAPGARHMNNQRGELEVIEYQDSRNVRVKFVGSGYETTARADNIRKGKVKDKYLPSVCGVGHVGEGDFIVMNGNKLTKEYQTWVSMLKRCYDQKLQARNPTYVGCSVCDEWHNFQAFAEWMATQDHEGKHLDKDIKVKGNKVYSPDVCLFVTQAENTTQARAKHYTFLSPNGEKVEVYNMRKFCIERGLHRGNMSQVHLGNLKHHKGWTKACTCNNT